MCFYQYFKLLHSPSLINKSSLFILELQSINESQPCWNSISCYIIPIDANFECLSSTCGRMSLIASINWSPVFQSIPQPSISMLSTNPLLFILNLARHTPVFALGLSEWLKNTTPFRILPRYVIHLSAAEVDRYMWLSHLWLSEWLNSRRICVAGVNRTECRAALLAYLFTPSIGSKFWRSREWRGGIEFVPRQLSVIVLLWQFRQVCAPPPL